MISLRRLALAILLASLVNTLLFTILFRDTDALLHGAALTAEYLMVPPIGLVAVVACFSLAWTSAGLLLLLAVGLLAIPQGIASLAAKLLFIGMGTGIGWVLFGLLFDSPLSMTVFGAVSALIFVLTCPQWFAAWDKRGLAES